MNVSLISISFALLEDKRFHITSQLMIQGFRVWLEINIKEVMHTHFTRFIHVWWSSYTLHQNYHVLVRVLLYENVARCFRRGKINSKTVLESLRSVFSEYPCFQKNVSMETYFEQRWPSIGATS